MTARRIPCRPRAVGRALALALAALTAALTTGCSDNMRELHDYIQQVKSRPGGKIEPIPEMQPFETYAYPETPLRDPFEVLSFAEPVPAMVADESGPRPDPTRPREPLEDFQLDSLAYVGTLSRDGETWALIQDPAGTIHRVQGGNYLGSNYGRITDISPAAVEVRELVATGQGGWIEREAALALHD